MSTNWFDQHRPRLEAAAAACTTRAFYSAFEDSPSPRHYPPGAARAGRAAFQDWLGQEFPVTTRGTAGTVTTERSPYGFDLGVSYPRVVDIDALIAPIRGGRAWRDAGPEYRVGLCVEILDRLHARGFEIAHAVKHTSGQPTVLAFTASVANALDRSLEALAWIWRAMDQLPTTAIWERPGRPGRYEKTFTIIPRGASLIIGSRIWSTWAGWPPLFASLAAGNRVIVQPHPGSVLPLAITVQVCREVLAEAGFDPDLVTLAVGDHHDRLHERLAVRPEVRLVDFTGSLSFCEWLEQRAGQAVLFTMWPGVNCVLIDSTDDFESMCDNLAMSLTLGSGQMLTAPQSLLVPRGGIETDQGRKAPADVADGLRRALDRLLADEGRAADLLGAITNSTNLAFIEQSARRGEVLIESRAIAHPTYPDARIRTPLLVRPDGSAADVYSGDAVGPVAYLVETADTEESIALFYLMSSRYGAASAGVYSISEQVLEEVRGVALDEGITLSENLLGEIMVNTSTAFSDFYGAGTSPTSSATLIDGGFVAPRFQVVQTRRPV